MLEKEKNPNSPGVVTHSSGNHGQAVAYAASKSLKISLILQLFNSKKIITLSLFM